MSDRPRRVEVERAGGSGSVSAPAAKLSRAEFFTLLGAVFAVFPILFCAMRILVVTESDPVLLRVLVQNLDLKTLVLATILPLGGTVVFWGQVLLWLFAYSGATPQEYRRLLRTSFWCLLPITFAILAAATPRAQLWVNLALLAAALVTVVAHQRLKDGWKNAVMIVGTLAFLVPVVAGIVLFVSNDDLWLPWESIKVAGQPDVEGYVLSSDGEWTRYMDSSDKSVYVVRTSDVKSRQVIDR